MGTTPPGYVLIWPRRATASNTEIRVRFGPHRDAGRARPSRTVPVFRHCNRHPPVPVRTVTRFTRDGQLRRVHTRVRRVSALSSSRFIGLNAFSFNLKKKKRK